MFALPLNIVSSFFLSAITIYIVFAYVQLVLFERMVKRDYPNAATFKTMSEENKRGFKKVGWKLARGLFFFIVIFLVKHYMLPGKMQ